MPVTATPVPTPLVTLLDWLAVFLVYPVVSAFEMFDDDRSCDVE